MHRNINRASKLGTLFLLMSNVSKKLKPVMWGWWYNQLARRDQHGELLFMNYGYYCPQSIAIKLESEDERYRQPIQLYEYVVNNLDLHKKNVVEIGCGRGGGATYLARYHGPISYTGIDLSKSAINWCKEHHTLPNIAWKQGSASRIPMPNKSTDIVVNVESSHCYPSMDLFLEEVMRILKPGGHLAFCDLRDTHSLDKLNEQIDKSGLKIIRQENITQNIVEALDKMSDSRIEGIDKKVPRLLKKAFRDFAAVRGSTFYEMFKDRRMSYVYYQCEK